MSPDPQIAVSLIVPRTEAEGPGTRFAVWVQGCPLRCPGCCNPEMLAFDETKATLTRASALVDAATASGAEGVSFLGGEPTAHAVGLAVVAAGVRARGMTVMVFSGFTLAELRAKNAPAVDELSSHTDLLVDGPYIEAQRTTSRRYIGSDNQVLHFLSDRYRPDDARFAHPNTLEIRLVGGKIVVNGFPMAGPGLTTIGKRT